MKIKPKISVVMPAYNAEVYISRAIESVLKQTLKDFELIIIDDKSKDDTYEIALSFSKKDKRIRVYKNKKNLSIASTLNRGISLAKSDIVARMDADDVSMPKRFEYQYKVLKNNKKVAVVGSFMVVTNALGEEVARRMYPINNSDIKKVFFRYSPFAHPAVMYRKSVVEKFGKYNKKIACEDVDLWFKIGSKYDFYNVPKYLLRYTLVNTSYSYVALRKIELDGLKVKWNAIKNLGFRPSLIDVIYNIGEYLTLWVMPSDFRVWLYNQLRNKNII